MPDGSKRSSAAARRHITTACNPCREDKTKCDGQIPSCKQCTTKQRHCTYADLDRRKVSIRKAVDAYSHRVRQLEDFILAHSLEVPAPDINHDKTLKHLTALFAPDINSAPPPSNKIVLAPVGSAADNTSPPSVHQSELTLDNVPPGVTQPVLPADLDPSHSGGEPTKNIDISAPGCMNMLDLEGQLPYSTTVDVDWVWNMSMMPQFNNEMFSDVIHDPFTAPDLSTSHDALNGRTLDLSSPSLLVDDNPNDDDDRMAVTNQLSARLGTLLITGNSQSRYYGSTSNFSLVHVEHMGTSLRRSCPSEEQVQEKLEVAGVNQPVDRDLVDHLVNLYFTWHDPSLHVVDREIFDDARAIYDSGEPDTPFFSPLLLNAMCAVGADFERKRHALYSGPLAEFFSKRATAVLELELEYPRISTVQALSILSSHEVAYTRDTRAWVFSGMAIRLAIDFGLHISTQPYVDAGSMTLEEARGRSVAFWGSFATDRMWSLYLGRPLNNYSKAVSIEKPMYFYSGVEERYWLPYGTPGRAVSPAAGKLPDRQEAVMEYWIQLLEIMSNLEDSLYFHADASNLELQRLAQDTFDKLLSWKANLPAAVNLNLDGPMPQRCLPHLIMLHMLYAYLIIVLHRPFVAKHYIQPYPPVGLGHLHARDMCVRAALQIAKLLSWYESQHSLSRASILIVQVVFSAALILVYATVSQDDVGSYQELSAELETCSHALVELGDTFENASRSLDVLLRVKRMWQARLVGPPAGSKRRGSSVTSRSKRPMNLRMDLQ